jgi:two-component system, OmpR family, KDP operon response regulator KdpE
LAALSMRLAPAAAPATIVIIEHDFKSAQALRRAIAGAGYDARVVETATQAFHLDATVSPACIVLHLCACPGNSIKTVTDLHSHFDVPLLIISEVSAEETKVQALEAGADDYLSKPFGMREFLARVGVLLRRARRAPCASKLRVGDLEIDWRARRVYRAGSEIRLTRKEFQILGCLAQAPGQVVSADSMLAEAWGSGFVHYSQTLRVHIGHLRHKLRSVPPEKDLIRTVAGVGYALISDD